MSTDRIKTFRLGPVQASSQPRVADDRKKVVKNTSASRASVRARKARKPVKQATSKWEGVDDSCDEDEILSSEHSIGSTPSRTGSVGDKDLEERDWSDEGGEEDDVPEALAPESDQTLEENLFPNQNHPMDRIEQIKRRFQELREDWFPLPDEEGREYYNRLQRNYSQVDFRDLQEKPIEEDHEYHMTLIKDVRSHVDQFMIRHNIGADELGTNNEAIRIKQELNKMLMLNEQTRDLLHAMFRQKVTVVSSPNSLGQVQMPPEEFKDRNPKQKFLEYLYQKCGERGYRRRGTMLYEPIFTKQGCFTHAYRQCMDLVDFVALHCQRHLSMENWLFMSGSARGTRAMFNDIVSSMELFVDQQLKKLQCDRHKFAFRNGVLLTRVLTPVENGRRNQERVSHRFYAYDHPDFYEVNASLIAAKYFDMDYVPYDDDFDYKDIPTPMLDHIFRFQFEKRPDYEEIYRFFLMNIGRMMFDSGDLEDWQYMTAFLGPGGTGKSTVTTHVVNRIYEEINVGILSNKIEAQFGLGGLLWERELFLTLGAELDKDCQLPVAMMLQMISGDSMSCAVKNIKNPIQVERWPTHMMMSANEFPLAWVDTGGRVMRRFVIFRFMRKVRDIIGDLPELLNEEMPNIIQKSVRAYHDYVNKYGLISKKKEGTGVWNFCPPYFKETQSKLAENSDLLRAFAGESGRVSLSPKLVVSEADFFTEFKDFCRTRGARSNIPSKDMQYAGLIQDLNYHFDMEISYEKRPQFEYEGQVQYNQHYFFGMGLSSRLSDAERQAIYEQTLERKYSPAEGEALDDDDEEEELDDDDEGEVVMEEPESAEENSDDSED